MDSARFERIEQVYQAALAHKPDERRAFLRQACGDDDDLRRQLEALLTEDPPGDDLLEGPASDLLAEFAGPQLTVGTQLGPYQIEGLLGVGGMGEVYLAYDPRLDRRVAVKLLPVRFIGDADAHERLRREALAAAALDHPFICKIFEVGEDNGALFVVMEYVRGETLYARLRAGHMPLSEALRIAGEIAEAIEEAHACRIIHRDLKPSNITMTSQSHVKVMDFGLARRVDREGIEPEGGVRTDAISGTLEYMSPEQAMGAPADHRSDLFAFGIILAELVNGKHPFQRSSSLETLSAILRDPPDLTAVEGSGVPAGLVVLIRRLLAKPPEERYASMRDVRADMARLADEPLMALRVGPAPRRPLVGRDDERARLVQLLDAALKGQGSIVLVSGEPGIGKTHLAQVLQAEAARRGCVTVTGHCYEMEGAPPYTPFVEMLEYGARALPRAAFRHALGDAAPEVAKLMPELRRIFPDIPPAIELPPDQQRRFLFNAYRDFVQRGARMTPWVALFEDLHWADESTLQLLRHLVAALSSMPVLLIGSYRDVELDVQRPFARTLETLLREKQATHIPLRRLAPEATTKLLESLSGHTPPPSATRIVFDHTEGNPFFVEEVFRHLADEGRLFDHHGEWRQGLRSAELRVPQGVRLVIGRRLEKLAKDARHVLTTAAVIGRSFDLRLLEDLEGARPDAVLDAVEAAERAHLIEAEDASRDARYRFVHELIRQTLSGTLSLPRRQRLHLRIADAMERIYKDNLRALAPTMAHHLYQAGAAADSEKTVTWLAHAAKQAAAGTAFDEGLAHLDNALLLLPGAQSVRVGELHAARAEALLSLGQVPDAIAGFEQALSVFELNGEADHFAEVCRSLAALHSWIVQPDMAREVCRRGLALLAAKTSPAGVMLSGLMAVAAVLANDIETGLAAFAELQQVRLPPSPPVIRAAASLHTYFSFLCGELEAARQAGNEANHCCESDGDLWGQADIAWMRADVAISLGHIDEGLAVARSTIPLAERIGHWGAACFCNWFIYERRVLDGDLEGAAELAQVMEEYDRLHYVPWGVVGRVTLANIARLRGRVEEAEEWARRANIPERNHWGGYPHAALALTLAQAGDPRLPQALSDALRFVPREGQPAPYGRWPTLSLVIEALAVAGRVDEVAALHLVAEEMIRRGFALTKAAALPRTTAGIAAACAHDWTSAEVHHQTAIQQADTWPHLVCRPIARYWYADMLRTRNDADDASRARSLLGEALKGFESLGMLLYARDANWKLAALRS